MIHAYAVHEPAGKLQPFEYNPGDLAPGQVEIDVLSCGICHSDLSMLDNQWGMASFPLVPGHEVAQVQGRETAPAVAGAFAFYRGHRDQIA